MNMLKKILLGFGIGSVIFSQAFAAEVDFSVNDIDSGKILITGTAPYDEHSPWITVKILNPGYETTDSKEAVNCMKQTVMNSVPGSEEGTWSVNIQLRNPESAAYRLLVNYYRSEKPIEKEINYYSKQELNDYCARIISAKESSDLEELKALLSDSDAMSFIGIRKSITAKADFDKLCESFIKNDSNITLVAEPQSVRALYEEQANLIILSGAEGSSYIKSAGTKGSLSAEVLQGTYKSAAAYEAYAGLSETLANAIAGSLGGKSYKNGDEFNKTFEFTVLKEGIQAAESYLDVRKLMSIYKSVFTNSWESAYNRLSASKKAAAETALISVVKSGSAAATDDIGNAFLRCIAAAAADDSGSSSSGGGGAGGGKVTSVPSLEISDKMNNELKKENTLDTGLPFIDLDTVPWAEESITDLAKKGVLAGKSKLKFEPQANVTREEFVKMLVLGLEISSEEAAECSFDDVMDTDWFRPYVALGVKTGVVSGISEQFFGSGMNITRQDMAVMIYRAAQKSGYSFGQEAKSFKDDSDIADYAAEAVSILGGAGIINGNEEGSFSPRECASRAEAAVIIYNISRFDKKEGLSE